MRSMRIHPKQKEKEQVNEITGLSLEEFEKI